MTTDVYKTPESEILVEQTDTQEFYIVSPKKFLILYLATMGMYTIYWFYKHWQQYKLKHNAEMWPVMRAIFLIFFTHSLFENFAIRLEEKQRDFQWSPAGLASTFVVISIIENVSNQLSNRDIGNPATAILGFIFLPLTCWILYKAQLAANEACGSPGGESNDSISALNILWIILGGLLWLTVGIGVIAIFMGL